MIKLNQRITICLTMLLALLVVMPTDAAVRRHRKKARTHRVVRKRRVVRRVVPPTIHENPLLCCEDTCSHIHGIDLSHYQGEVFWNTIGEHSKMAYVYLKASEGSENVDPLYERNIELAHRHGLKVGSYHFFRPAADIQTQLDNFKAQCLPGEQDLIPMLDVETDGRLSSEEFCDSLLKMLSLMEKAYHQKPLVYTYRNFYNKHLQGKIDDYQLMVAMYADEEPVLEDGRDYTLWQYSCRGRIMGITGLVDKSRFMGNHELRDIRYRH